MSFVGKSITIIALLVLAVLGQLYVRDVAYETQGLGMQFHERATVGIHRVGYEARVEVARIPLERIQGLSGRADLAPGTGMVFVFDMLDQHRIWMKDMQFSIDVIWIAGGVVVDTHERLPVPPPGTDPATLPHFNPRPQALFAVEVPAGTIAQYGIIHGDQIRITFDAPR